MSHSQAHRQSLIARTRTARIAVSDGNVVGVCIFLTDEDLRELNIDLHEVRYVRYSIDGETSQLEVTESALPEREHGSTDQ